MKKLFQWISIFFLLLLLSGCTSVGDRSLSLTYIYFTTAVLSLVLLIGCIFSVKKNKLWFVTLFSSVLIVNIGYTLLSLSFSLEIALWANRISYLGSVFLPLAMLMIILKVTNTSYKKWLPKALFAIAIIVFLIAASPGILNIYYKDCSFTVENGVSKLIKVYGPLHFIYLIYLLAYFSSMVAVIIRAKLKKTIESTSHAVIIAIAVFVNLGVWFIEQLVSLDFEMLSVSYIISESFLMGVHLVVNEYQKMSQIVNQVKSAQSYSDEKTMPEVILDAPISPERIEIFISGTKNLTHAEKAIYDAYIQRLTTNEILQTMNIKESTLKYHSRNIYGKLGVSTRKELLEIYKHIKTVKSTLDEREE